MAVGLGNKRRDPYGNSGGGLAFNPKLKLPQPRPEPVLTGPPQFTFDPALEAQRRAAERGLEDTEADVRKKQRYEGVDWRQNRRDITTKTKRGRADLNRDLSRGNEDLSTKETDVQRDAQRSREDFQTRLNNVSREFGELAERQAEAANAAGVNDSGTSAAAAAARARRQLQEEEPIHTAKSRMEEDLVGVLSKIGTERGRLGEDYGTGMDRLVQERDRSRLLEGRRHGRTMFDLKTERERARREGAITDADLLEQQIWQARENHPGAFKKWAADNPEVMALVKGENAKAAGGKPKAPKVRSNAGAIIAPPPPKKKGRR